MAQTPAHSADAAPLEPKIALLRASVVIGSLLADGIGDAILIRGEAGGGQSLRLAYNILQAAGCRSFKTDYVACPCCGRTLFNLQTVTARIKARTEHLKGVKIAIMGCIVNGPGEMADADFGYVGGAPGKINLYVGKQAIKFNIPEAEAVDRLVDLIKEHNKWVEPETERREFLTQRRQVLTRSRNQKQLHKEAMKSGKLFVFRPLVSWFPNKESSLWWQCQIVCSKVLISKRGFQNACHFHLIA